jgi:hypothetical protein
VVGLRRGEKKGGNVKGGLGKRDKMEGKRVRRRLEGRKN